MGGLETLKANRFPVLIPGEKASVAFLCCKTEGGDPPSFVTLEDVENQK